MEVVLVAVIAFCAAVLALKRWRRHLHHITQAALTTWYVLTFPFWLSWKLWEGFKWCRKKWKLWTRKPAFGDSSWAEKAELKRAGNLQRGGFVAGKLNGALLRTHREHSLLMFGRPGSGKSLTMGASLADAADDTLVVYDPPGMLLKRFRAGLEGKGYRVLRIDLNKPLEGAVYDICAVLDGADGYVRDTYMRDVASLATADLHDGGKNSEHFADTARILVQGILEWLWENDRKQANLFRVSQILLSANATTRGLIFKQISQSGSEIALRAVNMWEAAESAKGGEASGFRSSVTRALDAWMQRSYRDLTTLDDREVFSWDDVFDSVNPTAVFLTGGVLREREVKHFVRVFFGQAAGVLAARYGQEAPTPPTKLMIDEGVVLGRCDPVLSAVEQMRKVKVSVFVGYQSMAQMRGIWGKDKANILMDCCDVVVSGGSKSVEDYKDLSQLIGQRTVKTMSKNPGGVSEGEAARNHFPIEAFFRLTKDESVGLLGNHPVLFSKPYRLRKNVVEY